MNLTWNKAAHTAAGLIIGSYITMVLMTSATLTQQPDVNVETPMAEAPTVDYTSQNNINVEGSRRNYIQGSDLDVEFDRSPRSVEIQDVDSLLEIQGSSMRPTAFTDNTLLLREYTGQDLEEGDIIQFSYNDKKVAHRIEGDYTGLENGGYYTTRGDNNAGRERVSPDQIQHVVVGVLFTGEN